MEQPKPFSSVPTFFAPPQEPQQVWPFVQEAPDQYYSQASGADVWSSSSYDAEAWERHFNAPAEPRGVTRPDVQFFIPYAPAAAVTPDASPRSTSSFSDHEESPRHDHGGEFFRCPVPDCMNAYRRKGDLKTHVMQRHKDRPDLPLLIAKPRSSKLGKSYPCTVPGCPSGFTRKSGLARHLRQKHESQPETMSWFAAHGADMELSSGDTPPSPASSPRQSSPPTTVQPQSHSTTYEAAFQFVDSLGDDGMFF